MTAKGWLLDLYSHEDFMVLWFRLQSGELLCLKDLFTYRFYAQGSCRDLQSLEKRLTPYLRRTTRTRKREFWSGLTIPVLEIALRSADKLPEIQRLLGQSPPGLIFYNCDLSIPQVYAWEKGLFPLCACQIEWERDTLREISVLDSPWDPDAALPDLRIMEIGLKEHPQIPLNRGNSLLVTGNGTTFNLEAAGPRDLLEELNHLFIRLDPDLLLTRHGDARILPFLWNSAQKEKMTLSLDRDPRPPGRTRIGQGRSYFSYGQVIHQSAAFSLYGRIHIDQHNSFFYREAGLEGILFLARLTTLPIQTVARATPGTAITSMQLDRAIRNGFLIPWKKGRPETFKTAWDLLTADKGGLVFQPPIGLWEQVAEIDFVSMYPNIMVLHNISPETMLCSCCPEPVVPEAGYNICRKREGLIPQTLRPILGLRTELKARIKAGHPRKPFYDAMQKALKWMLVTCFGYTGYKNARFGRIEAHEAITAFGRDKLLSAKECAEAEGFRVLHGLTDALWIHHPDITTEKVEILLKKIQKRTGVPISLEGIYHWIAFLSSKISPDRPVANRYFGLFQAGMVKVRGIDCCRHDTPPYIKAVQEELLLILSAARDKNSLYLRIPIVLERIGEVVSALTRGRVDPRELVITRRVSKTLEEYKVNTPTVLALQQLDTAGIHLFPGQRLAYLLREKQTGYSIDETIKPDLFLNGDEEYNLKKYLDLVYKASKEILTIFKFEINILKKIYDIKH
jgi:DNA polymerase-2